MNPSHCLVISVAAQNLQVFHEGRCVREFAVSTALNGVGFELNSYRTPTGRFRIAEKIGGGQPSGTIFKCRVAAGLWQPNDDVVGDLILSRILRLEGLDEANANTLERCIYIHGTNHEDMLGEPASHGCVRLANAAMIELFDLVAPGDLVEIGPAASHSDG